MWLLLFSAVVSGSALYRLNGNYKSHLENVPLLLFLNQHCA